MRWIILLVSGGLVAVGCARQVPEAKPTSVAAGPTYECDPGQLSFLASKPCPVEGASCGECPKEGGVCNVLVCKAGLWQSTEVPPTPPFGAH